jgi:hypothetical protein
VRARPHEAGVDRRHVDALLPQLRLQALGEAGKGELADAVRGKVGNAETASNRHDVDDAAFAPSAHPRKDLEGRIERTPEGRLQAVVEVGEAHVLEGAGLDDPRVVHEHVDGAEGFLHLLERVHDLAPHANVARDREDLRPLGGERRQ